MDNVNAAKTRVIHAVFKPYLTGLPRFCHIFSAYSFMKVGGGTGFRGCYD